MMVAHSRGMSWAWKKVTHDPRRSAVIMECTTNTGH